MQKALVTALILVLARSASDQEQPGPDGPNNAASERIWRPTFRSSVDCLMASDEPQRAWSWSHYAYLRSHYVVKIFRLCRITCSKNTLAACQIQADYLLPSFIRSKNLTSMRVFVFDSETNE